MQVNPTNNPHSVLNENSKQDTVVASQAFVSLNGSLNADESRSFVSRYQDTKYMVAFCFIIVLPSIMLLIYLFSSTDSKRHPGKLGFHRLGTTAPEDADGEDEDEGTRFMKRTPRASRFDGNNNSDDSEDELYNVDNSWSPSRVA